MGATKKDRRINAVLSVLLTILCIAWMYPVFMILMNSLKTERAITTTHAFELPNAETFVGLKNYIYGIQEMDFLSSFWYSLVITVSSVALILLCCSMCAWYITRVQGVLGNVRVYNYYGMAEQLGSVFVECEHGHMHCSNYSDVIIRRSSDFSVAGQGERGLIELLSVLPTSYPGHVLLTEDEGEVLGVDDCPCGRLGKYFKIHGRIRSAELRGCSDTYERR